jgi:hypothetical protein
MTGLNHPWLGILAVVCGLLLLAIQAYAFFAEGLISTGLTGGGAGLILLGVVCFFYRAEDESIPIPPPTEPTADEYDAFVDGLEAGAAEPEGVPPPARR